MTLKNFTNANQALLFGDTLVDVPDSNQASSEPPKLKYRTQLILVDAITPNPWQPRVFFDQMELAELGRNIEELGLLQPIVVKKSTTKNHFVLVVGERRWRAHKQIGRTHIPAIISEVDDVQMPFLALTENTSRENLTDYEISRAIWRLENDFPERSRKELAATIGISRPVYYRLLAFQDLPDFILRDLEIQPRKMSNKVAVELKKIIGVHGQAGVDQLRVFWKNVVNNDADPSQLPELIKAAIERSDKAPLIRQKRNFNVGEKNVGSACVDDLFIIVKLNSSALPDPHKSELFSYMDKLLAKTHHSIDEQVGRMRDE